MITRLHLAPSRTGASPQILDVPDGLLMLDIDGIYHPPADAQYATVRNAATGEQEMLCICFREQLDEAAFYPSPVTATDPTGGECVCLVSCPGVKIQAPVTVTSATLSCNQSTST